MTHQKITTLTYRIPKVCAPAPSQAQYTCQSSEEVLQLLFKCMDALKKLFNWRTKAYANNS